MDRRQYLAAAVSVAFAGCSEADTRPAGTATSGQGDAFLSPGESVSHGGLEMSVSRTQTADVVTTTDWNNRGDNNEELMPSGGATYALAWVRVENVGDGERVFPLRDGEISLLNGGEPAQDVFLRRPILNDGGGEMYRNELIREEAADGAFPGTVVEGWAVFEIAENFDSATVAVEYPDEAAADENFEWQFGN